MRGRHIVQRDIWTFVLPVPLSRSRFVFLIGDENPGVKRRDVRFLDSIFGGSHSSPKDIQVPAQADSSLLESELFCQGPCQDGWVSNMGQCYKFVQEQNTWADAEVPGSSK